MNFIFVWLFCFFNRTFWWKKKAIILLNFLTLCLMKAKVSLLHITHISLFPSWVIACLYWRVNSVEMTGKGSQLDSIPGVFAVQDRRLKLCCPPGPRPFSTLLYKHFIYELHTVYIYPPFLSGNLVCMCFVFLSVQTAAAAWVSRPRRGWLDVQ